MSESPKLEVDGEDKHQPCTKWVLDRGCVMSSVIPTSIPGKGLGILATESIESGKVLVSLPFSLLITRKSLPDGFLEGLENISVHGALAGYLSLDSLVSESHWSYWRSTLPSKDDFMTSNPIYWDSDLQDCLPGEAHKLLEGQRQNLKRDLAIFQSRYPSISNKVFSYHWMVVNTRSFYYEYPGDEKHQRREDRMALCPFVDYFNHSDQGCNVAFTQHGFEVKADREYASAEEVFVSYGNHSNDFLLAEYGFIMSSNRWDEIELDSMILPQFSPKQKERLKHAGYLGKYVLDHSQVCYRTEIAIRLLLLPVQAWHRFVSGTSDGTREQVAVDHRLSTLLEDYQVQISGMLDKIKTTRANPREAHAVLLMRWDQINMMVEKAIQRLK